MAMTVESERKIVEAATPGPWKWEWSDDITKRPTALFDRHLDSYIVAPGVCATARTKSGYEDAEFIAHARTGYPLALDVVEAAKKVWHGKSSHPDAEGFYCVTCYEHWPCPFVTALAAFETGTS